MPKTSDTDKQHDADRTVVEFHGSRSMYVVNTAIGIITIIAMMVLIVIAIVQLL